MPANPTEKTWESHHGPVLDSSNGFDVIECAECHFKHVVPIPTEKELEALYRHDYYSREKPLYIERHREDREWWDVAYGDRYEEFERLLPAGRRRLLDVGSGPGLFLHHGAKRGWKVVGCEPAAQAAAHARTLGLEIIERFLDDETARSLGQFDVVHMSEVLEHIPSPATLVERARRLLTPGGLLCVVVPNDYSPFQLALRKASGFAPWWVAPPHHLNYFDFASLKALFARCGFETVVTGATFPIDMFLLMGENYVGNDEVGRRCHGRRKTLELKLEEAGMGSLRRELNKTFANVGVGREIVLIGKRV